jgi:hypothetical protein
MSGSTQPVELNAVIATAMQLAAINAPQARRATLRAGRFAK